MEVAYEKVLNFCFADEILPQQNLRLCSFNLDGEVITLVVSANMFIS